MSKRTLIHWIIILLAAMFICCLPVLCKAEPRLWTLDEKTFLVWGSLGAVADMYTTTQFLRNSDNYEINPIIGEHPDPLTVITYIASEYLISITIAHFWPDLELPLIGKVNMRHQILYNRASRYTANACWNARLDWGY